MTGIIGTDQQHNNIGRRPSEIAMVEPPQQVLGTISVDPSVKRTERGKILLPDVSRPALGN
jgi:hypothetical protein